MEIEAGGMTWAKIAAALLGLFQWLARRLDEMEVRRNERDRIELETRRDQDSLDALVDHAVEQLRHDAESIAADRRNRARDPLQDNRKDPRR